MSHRSSKQKGIRKGGYHFLQQGVEKAAGEIFRSNHCGVKAVDSENERGRSGVLYPVFAYQIGRMTQGANTRPPVPYFSGQTTLAARARGATVQIVHGGLTPAQVKRLRRALLFAIILAVFDVCLIGSLLYM